MAEERGADDQPEDAPDAAAGVEYDFRPVVHGDMVMLSRWLREPVVSTWWRDAVKQLAAIQDHLSDPALDQVIVLADGQPIAYAQISDVRHDASTLFDGLPQGTLAIDCFSAPEGMGQGGAWLTDMAGRLLQNAQALVVDPEFGNTRAIAAYAKAGFSGNMLRLNEEGRQVRLMTRYR